MLWNVFFEGAILICIFWVSNFNVRICFEMYFLREQFWDVFFEGAILMLWSIFFEGAILKCIFWGSNLFRIYGCWLVWLVADLLDSFILSKRFKLRTELEKKYKFFFIKVFTTTKTFEILTYINTNLRCITNWLQSS